MFGSAKSLVRSNLQIKPQRFNGWLTVAVSLSLATIALPTRAAERIYVSYGLLERSIPVESLQTYASSGLIDEELKAYAQYAGASQLQQLRDALLAKADLSPVAISQFLYSPQGEILLKRLGQVIQPESRLTGFKALRAALILAAADGDGLTLLNVLRKFPTRGIRVDVQRSLDILDSLNRMVWQTNQAAQTVIQQSTQELSGQTNINVIELPDLRQRGSFGWDKSTLTLVDPSRPTLGGAPQSGQAPGRTYPVDLYLPAVLPGQPLKPAPVVVISHGLGSDRNSFLYLAHQLASYGFAVLVPEHPGSNAKQLAALLNGIANEVSEPTELVDRPLDITFLLDYLEKQTQFDPKLKGRLNLNQVGVIGHSFGGYTALVLAGAPINLTQLGRTCQDLENTLNLSLLLQCRGLALKPTPNLRDPRVKAVVAINPFTSAILGADSLAQIAVPTLSISSSADTVAPALPEQIQPFTTLTTAQKYLALLDGGTHFSAIDGPENGQGILPLPPEVVGANPAVARRYINALSTAFFLTYVANQPNYLPYLTAAYTSNISEIPMPLSLVRQLSPQQLPSP